MANAVLNFGRFFLSSIILHDFTQNNEIQCITFKMRENGICVNKNNVKTKAFIWVFPLWACSLYGSLFTAAGQEDCM